MSFITIVKNSEETKKLGLQISQLLFAGALITLEGDLGAGKTTFTKAIGEGLGIKQTINSPTFTILKIYEDGILPLYHMDMYRLEGITQDLGFDEYIEGEGVCIIEWASFVKELLPETYLEINIERIDDQKRKFTMTAHGLVYENILEALK